MDSCLNRIHKDRRGGSLAALRAAALKGVAYSVTKPATSSRRFFIAIPRSSELGSAINEKTQALGPGFVYLVAILERRSNSYLNPIAGVPSSLEAKLWGRL